ncbi:hypothetical protein FDENT_6802 [Fusarium denticulatum]|uniref:Uncharacterized protein n=1 Tax=Fusarium denticulatum TaxID=48507 RepID=A0A8H5UAE0_9HYPO|nr:hypothetical protein FDENT_6802 [Fusarium denticulatum]
MNTQSQHSTGLQLHRVQGALQSVEYVLENNQEVISRYKIEEAFSIAAQGCRATLACIEQEFELLFNRSDWKARFLVLWKQDDMEKLLGRLDRKRDSILLLLQLLSLQGSSVREVKALVTKRQGALTVAKEDITALMPTYWTCRETILDSLDKETVDSIYTDWENPESKLSTTEFDFDWELINTRVYRRALAQVTEASRVDWASDEGLDEPLDGDPLGSSQFPKVFTHQQSLADLEAEHGHGGRLRASPRGSDDHTRPRGTNIARRSRPKVEQIERSKSADSTEVNPGTPPKANNPRFLKTLEDAIQRLILPELNAKRETARGGVDLLKQKSLESGSLLPN